MRETSSTTGVEQLLVDVGPAVLEGPLELQLLEPVVLAVGQVVGHALDGDAGQALTSARELLQATLSPFRQFVG